MTAWLSEVVGWLTTNELRADLMEHCLGLDAEFHTTHSPGELIERVDGDLNGLSMFFAQFLLNVGGNLVLLVGVLIVVAVQSPFAGGVFTLFALAAVVLLAALRRVAATAWERGTRGERTALRLHRGALGRHPGHPLVRRGGAHPQRLLRPGA